MQNIPQKQNTLDDGVICLAGMNRSCFPENKLSTSLQTEKRPVFNLHLVFVTGHSQKKNWKMGTSESSFTCSRVIFPLLWTLKTPEEVWSPAYGITQGCYHLTPPEHAFWH